MISLALSVRQSSLKANDSDLWDKTGSRNSDVLSACADWLIMVSSHWGLGDMSKNLKGDYFGLCFTSARLV